VVLLQLWLQLWPAATSQLQVQLLSVVQACSKTANHMATLVLPLARWQMLVARLFTGVRVAEDATSHMAVTIGAAVIATKDAGGIIEDGSQFMKDSGLASAVGAAARFVYSEVMPGLLDAACKLPFLAPAFTVAQSLIDRVDKVEVS
jgi:hypothetical protein